MFYPYTYCIVRFNIMFVSKLDISTQSDTFDARALKEVNDKVRTMRVVRAKSLSMFVVYSRL